MKRDKSLPIFSLASSSLASAALSARLWSREALRNTWKNHLKKQPEVQVCLFHALCPLWHYEISQLHIRGLTLIQSTPLRWAQPHTFPGLTCFEYWLSRGLKTKLTQSVGFLRKKLDFEPVAKAISDREIGACFSALQNRLNPRLSSPNFLILNIHYDPRSPTSFIKSNFHLQSGKRGTSFTFVEIPSIINAPRTRLYSGLADTCAATHITCIDPEWLQSLQGLKAGHQVHFGVVGVPVYPGFWALYELYEFIRPLYELYLLQIDLQLNAGCWTGANLLFSISVRLLLLSNTIQNY